MNAPIVKPLGRKAYGSIGHLPNSRMGPKDHHIHPGQAKICTGGDPGKSRSVIVQEKLDGSCCAVARIDGILHPLGRAGWPAVSSPYLQHRFFHNWVMLNSERFFSVLEDGERIVGEWIAQAHGTRYEIPEGADPFIPFDIMRGDRRFVFIKFVSRVASVFKIPTLLSGRPSPVEEMLAAAQSLNSFRAVDPIEGVVYRVEEKTIDGWRVEFLAKYVRPDKVDGCYLPEVSGKEPIWNWHP